MTDAEQRSPRYIKRSGDPDLSYFPDFLIVGPQRTGTTWLHAHLRYHPQIMLAEPKELFFFSSLKTPDSPRYRSNELGWYLQFFHEPLWRVVFRNLMSVRLYRELYRPQVRGEATASYATLDRDVIQEIAALKPDIKIVLMIREPIDRAWSHAKKDLVRNKGRKFAEVSAGEFERFFAEPYQRQCARYVEQIDNWSVYLRPGNLLVGLFDDVDAQPEALLLEVMRFLGVASDRRYISGAVSEPVNPTGVSTIPEQYRRRLEALLKDDIIRLKERLGLSWDLAGKLERRPGGSGGFRFALD
ncbi:MAG: sulfotransferase [Deltaproteobacteria bacterium]|nr:sulfotransferase [Deltaproteobacteria bacterium]MBI3389445.1 sulfotransferase [Deltaproteobacteria bacterium]